MHVFTPKSSCSFSFPSGRCEYKERRFTWKAPSLTHAPCSVCVASLMRVILLARISSLNQTYAAAPIAIWSVVECNLSIIVGSLPIIRSLFASSSSENSHSSRWSGLRQWFTTPSHAASKLSSSGHRASGFRQIWRSEKTQDDSQVDLARGEDGASKNSDSKDAEIAIELTERPNPALAFHDKHG